MGAGTPFPLGARIADCLSAEDLAKIRALIRRHERRLQGVDPALLTTLIVVAMRADLAAELSLEAALTRAAIAAVNLMRGNTPEP
jgi:predicted component of type VI protein secretion system